MNEMKKDTILFLIQLPPPVNGVSVMNRALIDSPRIRERYRQIVVPISMNRAMNGLGKFALGKLFKSVGIFFSLFWALLRYRPDVVYVTVSPFGYAFCRDFFYISLIRLFRRQRILPYLLNCFQDKISLTAIKRLEVILGFRKVFKFPVHSISTLSKSLRSSSVTPRRRFISSSEISFDGS